MIKISTKLIVVDNSGAKLAKCIKLMGKQKISTVGNLILVTLFKFTCSKKVKKRTIYLGLIVGISYWTTRIDGSYIKFFSNRLLVFNKSYKFLGTRVYGVILKEIRLKSIKDKNYRKFFQKLISYSSLIV